MNYIQMTIHSINGHHSSVTFQAQCNHTMNQKVIYGDFIDDHYEIEQNCSDHKKNILNNSTVNHTVILAIIFTTCWYIIFI